MGDAGERLVRAPKKDSIFAFGSAMRTAKLNEVESQDFGGRAFEVMQYMGEAEALTVSAVARLLETSKFVAGKSLTCLWYAGLARWVTVAGNNAVFKLWLAADARLPGSAQEACRMAVLGLYYAHARKEVPGFEWRVIRNAKKPVCAEMAYLLPGNGEKARMVIDAPRRKEKPNPDAGLYIFPTVDEAKAVVPKGKRFTTDLHLMQYNEPLNRKIFEVS